MNKTIGFAVCGSFCTFSKVIPQIEILCNKGYNVIPIMSEISYSTDTRFGKAIEHISKIETLTGKKIIHTIKDAEPIGPKNLLDAIIVAPCTGNTLSKIANGITDSCVSMAVKAQLRNGGPAILAISTNDGLGASGKNIGTLHNCNNIYFVPYGQDDPIKKPTSLVADMNMIPLTLEYALENKQIQPILIQKNAR